MVTSPAIAVAIPLHSNNLSADDVFSVRNTFAKLRAYDIVFVIPVRLLDWLRKIGSTDGAIEATYVAFDDVYFESVASYNRLLLTTEFYARFQRYEYLLIVQTDALVFSDSLVEWCQKGFSFIGAPFLEGYGTPVVPYRFIGVGNGGFSLRRVAHFRRVLGYPLWWPRLWRGLTEKALPIVDLIRTVIGDLKQGAGDLRVVEDEYFGATIPRVFKWFVVPEPEQAMYFSLEVAPSYGFGLMSNQLPFGCHAWKKYDAEFWEAIVVTEMFEQPSHVCSLEGLFSLHARSCMPE